jgi:hypothetical protein
MEDKKTEWGIARREADSTLRCGMQNKGRGNNKSENKQRQEQMRGFFPFGSAQGQNDNS